MRIEMGLIEEEKGRGGEQRRGETERGRRGEKAETPWLKF